ECTENEITLEYLNALNKLEPFGVANPKPIFILNSKNVFTYPMNKHNEHLLMRFDNYSGVMFNKPYYIYTLNNKAKKSIFCYPYIEANGKKDTIKVLINSVYCNDVKDFSLEISQGCHFKQNIYAIKSFKDTSVAEINIEDFEKLQKSGVVYISYYSNIKDEILNALKFDICDFVYLSHKGDDNTLLIAPLNYDGLDAFKFIVFIDEIIDNNFLNYMQFKYPNAKIMLLKNGGEKYNLTVSTNKEVFVNFYSILRSIKDKYFDEINMYKKCFSCYGFSFSQFIFCLYVFDELGIIKMIKDKDFYFILDEKKKTNLYNSTLYCKMLGR
ncbi:MAG: hypothetical protein ACI4TX_01450, partial [Christensenellales bacterium]